MNEPKSIHSAEDWGVVLQSVPSKNKREIVKRLEEIFLLDKRDAEQILSNMPLILVDNISFGLAARIKKFFQKIGAVAETTNHDMIKKNCFQVLWPQTPDLAFFMKNEAGLAEVPAVEAKGDVKPAENPPVGKSPATFEMSPEIPKAEEPASPKSFAPEPPPAPAHFQPVSPESVPEAPAFVPQPPPAPKKLVQESPAVESDFYPIAEEKPATDSSAGMDLDWERRAKELNDKLRAINEEKQVLRVRHVEAAEKVKSEFQQQLEEEKKKSGEIAKAYEDLQKEAQKHEALTREGEEWRSRAVALGEKVRELETHLMEKGSTVEQLTREKDELARQAERSGSETQQELSALRGREQDFSRKIEGLEQNVQEMTESLRSRDGVLAQFEKQILHLAEKAQAYESLRLEHAQLSKERATIREEYDAKFAEQEVRFAKIDEEHRRYRSRTDRKNAAATRELGEWIRGVDTIRQGLQKLILFLGSESAVLDSEKKSTLRSPLTRGPDAPNTEKN